MFCKNPSAVLVRRLLGDRKKATKSTSFVDCIVRFLFHETLLLSGACAHNDLRFSAASIIVMSNFKDY